MMLVKKSKKGVEPIVGTVLLLLITVAAAGIIFGIIVPLIQDKLLSGDIGSCMSVRISIDVKQGYTCYDEDNQKVSVMVSRGADDVQLYGVQVIVGLDSGTTQAFEINRSIAEIPGKNEKNTYQVQLNAPPGAKAKEVGIAAIVGMGAIKQLCGVTSTTKLTKCY